MKYFKDTVFIKFRNHRKRETSKDFEIFETKKPQIRIINLNNPFEYCPVGLFLLLFLSKNFSFSRRLKYGIDSILTVDFLEK